MKENQTPTIEEGAGTYDFEQLTGMSFEEETTAENDEPQFDVVNEDQPEATPIETEEEPEVEEEKPKEEPEKPSEEQQEEIEEEQEQAVTSSNYSSLAKKYIELGLWADKAIEVDGEAVAISKLKDLPEDTFLQIQQAQQAEKDKEIQEKYINTDDLDDVSKELVEISKNGGNVTQLLEAKKNTLDRLEEYDLDNEVHQEFLVRQMYQVENKALSPKQIDKLIADDKSEMELDLKARKFVDNVKLSFKQQVEFEKEQAIEAQENEKKSLKDLKKNLREEMQELGLKNDKVLSVILDQATRKEKDGFGVDKDFQELKKDPKLYAEYLVWRNDRENFFKNTVSKLSTKRDVKQLQLLDLAPKNTTKKKTERENKQETSNLDEDFFSKIKIINKE